MIRSTIQKAVIPVFVATQLFVPLLADAGRTWPAAVGEGNLSRWSGDRISAFTVTIDDNLAQDHAFWKALGEESGLKWTWCVITENVGSDGSTWAGWQELVDLGHGIASHGLHAYDENTPGINVTNEYRDSQLALRGHLTGIDALALAYPNGYKPPNDSVLAAQYYIAARGVNGGVNTGNSINYTNVLSVSMNPTTAPGITDPATWYYYGHAIDPAHQYYEGWQSVHFHSVLASMVDGVTNLAAELSANEADIWTGRFQDVAQYGQERENATLNVTSVSGTEIRFTVTDTLDDARFYFPLTVKIRVDSAWSSVTAVQNGQEVSAELVEHAGNNYALVQAVPDAGEVTLMKEVAEGLLVVVRGAPENQLWVDGTFSGSSSGSYAAPYKTVQAGLDAAAPGDTVSVREGVYRETVVLPSGTVGQPITLAGAPGERVVLNGLIPVDNWQAMTGGFYSKQVSWQPAAMYAGFRKLVLAREPNEGWWEADSVSEDGVAGTLTITDTANLTGFPHDLTNASVYLWTQGSDQFYTCPIISFDPVLGRVEFEKTNPSMAAAAGDKYWLQNQVSLMDQPDEWAVLPEGADFRIYYAPADRDDLAIAQIPAASGLVVNGQNAAHVRLGNLEVTGGAGQGIYLAGAQHVEVNRCIVHNNVLYGIWLDGAQSCSVKNSILINNRFGIACLGSSDILVEENEIGNNGEDGLLFTWGSTNMTARRNYIHNHMLWGHPDNSQTYRGVEGVHYIDNLIMAGGQSVMMQETTDVECTGNMVVGSVANMVNFGHSTVTNVLFHGNTLACAGYSALGLTGEQGYDIKDNIFMNGHRSQLYKVTDAMDYQGDYNLFWNGAGLVDPTILVSEGTWGSGPSPSDPFSIVYENNNVAAGDTSTPADSVPANIAAGALSLPPTFPASNWPNVLTALQNNAGINSLATAISSGDYFTFTITPDAGAVVSYSNLFVRVSLGANVPPAKTTFTLMSSLTGFTSTDALAGFTNETLATSTMGIQNSLDLGNIPELQNVAAGTAVEFRLYAHNTGVNSMTRIGIGHGFWTGTADDDLRLEGTVSVGGAPPTNGVSETIYHTSLASFQATTGLELNSAYGDPVFANAPYGFNVMDNALLHQATYDTFALRDTNYLTVGDHVELNFDGVVRTVTASSGAVVTVSPPLEAKPLKGMLVANWGTNTNFALDLGLQPGSPGIGLGQGGGTVGSSVSIQEYQSGDFDGDGRRDLPKLPADLE